MSQINAKTQLRDGSITLGKLNIETLHTVLSDAPIREYDYLTYQPVTSEGGKLFLKDAAGNKIAIPDGSTVLYLAEPTTKPDGSMDRMTQEYQGYGTEHALSEVAGTKVALRNGDMLRARKGVYELGGSSNPYGEGMYIEVVPDDFGGNSLWTFQSGDSMSYISAASQTRRVINAQRNALDSVYIKTVNVTPDNRQYFIPSNFDQYPLLFVNGVVTAYTTERDDNNGLNRIMTDELIEPTDTVLLAGIAKRPVVSN